MKEIERIDEECRKKINKWKNDEKLWKIMKNVWNRVKLVKLYKWINRTTINVFK